MSEVRCPCCSKPVIWQPYRVQQRLFICFRCETCDLRFQIEARFDLAEPLPTPPAN